MLFLNCKKRTQMKYTRIIDKLDKIYEWVCVCVCVDYVRLYNKHLRKNTRNNE